MCPLNHFFHFANKLREVTVFYECVWAKDYGSKYAQKSLKFLRTDCLKLLRTCCGGGWYVLHSARSWGEPRPFLPQLVGLTSTVYTYSCNQAGFSSWPKNTVGFFQMQLHEALSQMDGSSWWGASERRGIWKKRKRTAKVPPPAKQAAVQSNVKCCCFCVVTLKNPTENTLSPRNSLLVKMFIYSSTED